jgi:hypothetical protein
VLTQTSCPYFWSHRIQTHRHSASSSTLSISEEAFIDLQHKYIADLRAHNMTRSSLEEGLEADGVLTAAAAASEARGQERRFLRA